MHPEKAAERAVQFMGDAGSLVGRLHLPSDPARAAAVVCHPHPLYGGDMDNHVVVAVAHALAADGTLALRFNFRGIGGSAGAHDGGPGEERDVLAACQALRTWIGDRRVPLAVIGYSFGAAVGLAAAQAGKADAAVGISPPLARRDFRFLRPVAFPVLLVWGEDDVFVGGDAARDVRAYRTVRVVTVPGADHFWWAGLEGLVAAVTAFLRPAFAGKPEEEL